MSENKQTMRERAFEILQNDIINGVLSPGERILEDAAAARCNVSRTPLREAIRQLEQEGLLERYANRGLVVSGLSLREASELYELRARLEGLAAHHATDRMDDVLREKLNGLLRDSCSFDPETGGMVMRDEMPWIHGFILEHCRHATCVDFLRRLKVRLDRYRIMTTRRRGDMFQVHREHSLIINYMLAGDGRGAEMAMQSHILIAYDLARKALSSKLG